MWRRLQWWWTARRTEPALEDAELRRSTREATKAIVQTLRNRSFRRPELATDEPLDSARRQRQFDRETLDGYREHLVPALDPLRAEYLARGSWTRDLEARYADPGHLDDVRDTVIDLERLAAAL